MGEQGFKFHAHGAPSGHTNCFRFAKVTTLPDGNEYDYTFTCQCGEKFATRPALNSHHDTIRAMAQVN